MGVKIESSRDQAMGSSESLVNPSAIELHIQELVLHGFQPADRRRIGDAVERELARLLRERGLSGLEGQTINIERIDAGVIKVAGDARPRLIGAQLARNLHRSLASPAQQPRVHAGEGRKTR